MLKLVDDSSSSVNVTRSLLDEIVLNGARALLAQALEAEVQTYIEAHAGVVDADGHRLVVRNGNARAREIKTGAGPIVTGSRL